MLGFSSSHPNASDCGCELDLDTAVSHVSDTANWKVAGVIARGGFTVNIDPRNGKVMHYRIASLVPREVKCRVDGETRIMRMGIL